MGYDLSRKRARETTYSRPPSRTDRGTKLQKLRQSHTRFSRPPSQPIDRGTKPQKLHQSHTRFSRPLSQPIDRGTKLQKLRQSHTRFSCPPKDKAIMTSRMQSELDQQQAEACFQAQEEYRRDLKMLAEHKGVTSGEIVLGTRVPRRYQGGLGAGRQEAEAYLRKKVKSPLDQQLVRDVAQGRKEETRVPICKAAKEYKKLLGDAQPEYDTDAHSQVPSSFQNDSGSDDDPGSCCSRDEEHSLDTSERKVCRGNLPKGSGVYVTMMLLQDQNIECHEQDIASKLGYNNGHGVSADSIVSVLEEYDLRYDKVSFPHGRPLPVGPYRAILEHDSRRRAFIAQLSQEDPDSYVVIDKIDQENRLFHIRSPYDGPFEMSIDKWDALESDKYIIRRPISPYDYV